MPGSSGFLHFFAFWLPALFFFFSFFFYERTGTACRTAISTLNRARIKIGPFASDIRSTDSAPTPSKTPPSALFLASERQVGIAGTAFANLRGLLVAS